MTIGIVIDGYLPQIGGAELYAYNLAKYLTKQGVRVKIFTLNEADGKPVSPEYQDEFPTVRVPYRRGLKGMLAFYRELKKFLADVDVIQAMYCHKFAAYVGVYNFFRRKPFIITEQGRGILDLPGNSWLYARVHELYRFISIRSADIFVASCREFIDRARRYIPMERIKYIPNGVDLATFMNRPLQPAIVERWQGKKVVLTVRRLVPKNGIQFLIETAPFIIAAEPNVIFVLVGYGELEPYLRGRVKALGIEPFVVFAGRVENALVPTYLGIARVVVFPSTAESTSLACLEAMAMKKAIVASRVGGYLDMIEDNKSGFLVTLVDSEDCDYDAPMDIPVERKKILAEKICLILGNEELGRRLGEGAYDRVLTTFSWDVIIRQIMALYNELLARRSSTPLTLPK